MREIQTRFSNPDSPNLIIFYVPARNSFPVMWILLSNHQFTLFYDNYGMHFDWFYQFKNSWHERLFKAKNTLEWLDYMSWIQRFDLVYGTTISHQEKCYSSKTEMKYSCLKKGLLFFSDRVSAFRTELLVLVLLLVVQGRDGLPFPVQLSVIFGLISVDEAKIPPLFTHHGPLFLLHQRCHRGLAADQVRTTGSLTRVAHCQRHCVVQCSKLWPF